MTIHANLLCFLFANMIINACGIKSQKPDNGTIKHPTIEKTNNEYPKNNGAGICSLFI